MKKDPSLFLEHIMDSIDKIETYTNSITEQEFQKSFEIQDAVIRRISVIGEASRNLPASFKKKHHEVNWRDINAMRNILIHEYFGVKVKKVWRTVQEDIPGLKEKVSELLRNLKTDNKLGL